MVDRSSGTRVVVVTPDELRELLDEAAEAAARRVLSEVEASTDWMCPEQVAHLLGYKTSYVSELVRRQGLPCRKIGRKMRFDRSKVEAWAAARGREFND